MTEREDWVRLEGPATNGGRPVTLTIEVAQGSPEHERFLGLGYVPAISHHLRESEHD